FIVPHFGGGCYDEALSVARAFVNVYFDTASSNSWITPPLTLRDVFKQALADLGAARILFGTDSSHFPRGWRKDIFDVQLDILESLEVSGRDQELIFGGNISRLLGLEL
ncbi:MAG TPA: amidohydrolase family protein, partial [bacterium]